MKERVQPANLRVFKQTQDGKNTGQKLGKNECVGTRLKMYGGEGENSTSSKQKGDEYG